MKVLILSNLVSYTYNFRLEIIKEFISDGHSITVVCDNDNNEMWKELESSCRMINVPFDGKGTNIKSELGLIKTYKSIIKEVKPDILFSFTIKMNLYGGLVSKRYKVPYVPMITGLGELEKKGKLRALLLMLHKAVMPKAKCVVFQNEDNKKFFIDNNIKFKNSIVVPGSGINLEKFKYEPWRNKYKTRFVFLGRLTEAKGIEEFLYASERLSSPTVEFYAAGKVDDKYKERVEGLVKEGKLHYEGILSDTREFLAASSCLVLPTSHPEGISNVILEAFATGRPVICTDRTGCKDVVSDGIDGLFCKAHDGENLIEVINNFLTLSKDDIIQMGIKGREAVERRFDRKIVVSEYRNLLR